MNDPAKVPWSVWTARVRYEDSPETKNRPVVILKNDDSACTCMVLAVTSKSKDERHGYKLKNTECVKLKKDSTVKLGYFELTHSEMIEFLGCLDPVDIFYLQCSLQAGRYGSKFL
jgi:hypothetical protein